MTCLSITANFSWIYWTKKVEVWFWFWFLFRNQNQNQNPQNQNSFEFWFWGLIWGGGGHISKLMPIYHNYQMKELVMSIFLYFQNSKYPYCTKPSPHESYSHLTGFYEVRCHRQTTQLCLLKSLYYVPSLLRLRKAPL